MFGLRLCSLWSPLSTSETCGAFLSHNLSPDTLYNFPQTPHWLDIKLNDPCFLSTARDALDLMHVVGHGSFWFVKKRDRFRLPLFEFAMAHAVVAFPMLWALDSMQDARVPHGDWEVHAALFVSANELLKLVYDVRSTRAALHPNSLFRHNGSECMFPSPLQVLHSLQRGSSLRRVRKLCGTAIVERMRRFHSAWVHWKIHKNTAELKRMLNAWHEESSVSSTSET